MGHPTGPLNPGGDPVRSTGGPPPNVPVGCVRHPDRPTLLRCARCDRPACPQCLREASVGHQCVDCVAEGRHAARRGVTVAGAEPTARPVVVPLLIALNVAVFAWSVAGTGLGASPVFVEGSLIPSQVAAGEWWRLVTAGFLHAGLVHLGLNMLALYMIGRDLEPVLGRTRFLAVYGVSLLGGSATVMLFPGDKPTVGASGAIFGLMGALVVVLLRLRLSPVPALLVVALNLYITFQFSQIISWQGHIGGLVVGVLAAAALVWAPGRNRNAVQAAALAGLTLLLLGVVAAALG